MAVEYVLDDRSRLVEGHVAILEYRHAAERVPSAMRIRLEIGRVESHLIELVLQVELGEQPDDSE